MKFVIVEILVIALVAGGQVLGYPQDRDTSDGGGTGEASSAAEAVPESKSGYEDSVAAASESGGPESYDDGDDSDMYMEPDGAESAPGDSRHEEAHHQQPQHPAIVAVQPVQTTIQVTSSESSQSEPIVEGTATSSAEKSLEGEPQNFFPSFAEIFANHRLPYEQQSQQQRYRPSRFLGYFQRDRPYQAQASSSSSQASSKEAQATLLGSGNFGVIRGGTYYPEDKDSDDYSIDETAFSPYYHSGGGGSRARSSYYKNPKPQPVRPGDFFANFRDFADITAPPKSSFSHLSVVYANRPSAHQPAPLRLLEQPRNIIETLRMLEEEEESARLTTTSTTEPPPTKKLSQGKRKLYKMKKYQEEKARKSRMTAEPLLALS